MGLIFIPFYISFLGIEAWGLIGIFATLQVIFGLLDMGLSGTLNREIARLSALPEKEQEMRNLTRTLEVIYWSVAVLVGIAVTTLAPYVAYHWIDGGKLSTGTVEQALLIMGLVIALQMPIGFYSGGLMGLQKQVILNSINIFMSTLRGVGGVLILWLLSPTIHAYFFWQIIVSALTVVLLARYLWKTLPPGKPTAAFQKDLFNGIWRFAIGMSGISILSVILTQLDKVILSKILSLEMFGYYMLASVVAMSLGRIFTPVFFSIYPRFTQLVATNANEELIRLYHKSCQFIAVLVLPIAIVISFFSYEVILLWTHSPVTAERTHLIVSIMICGTALNGLLNPPYALQLAFGWTRLSVLKNIVAVILLVPLIIILTLNYGGIGAASAWLIVNIGYVVFEIPLMHRRLLREEMWRWYWQDVGVPLVACAVVAGVGRVFISEPMSRYMMMLWLIIVSGLTLGIAALATPVTKAWLFGHLFPMKVVRENR
jgi:O-antigen/teichoic acid export membrane protein